MLKRAIALLAAALPPAVAAAQTGNAPLFVLKQADGKIVIEKTSIADGETQVFLSNGDTGVIDVVVPPGVGGSAGLQQLGQPRTIVVRFSDGALNVTTRAADGKSFARPPQPLTDLRAFDIRVSVIGAGAKQAFLIREYDTVTEDGIAPVVDLFGGKVQVSEGDFLVTTQTTRRSVADADALTGEFAFDYLRVPSGGGYLLATGRLPDGSPGCFVVDLAAGQTVVAKRVVPEGVAIEPGAMLEHSAQGTRRLGYAVGGATGRVNHVLGLAELPALSVGSMTFDHVNAMVMDELFELGGRRIDGIIGMNVLRRAASVAIEYPRPGASAGRVVLGGPADTQIDAGLRVPFASVGALAFVRGRIGGRPVSLVLDSGSSSCLMTPESAAALDVKTDPQKTRTIHGLDGVGSEVSLATVGALELGDRTFRDVPFEIGPLAALDSFKTGQSAGILGNAFFERFRRVEIDFKTNHVLFVD